MSTVLTFTDITIDEANLIISALSKLPYEISVGIISKLQAQAQPQLNPPTPASPSSDS